MPKDKTLEGLRAHMEAKGKGALLVVELATQDANSIMRRPDDVPPIPIQVEDVKGLERAIGDVKQLAMTLVGATQYVGTAELRLWVARPAKFATAPPIAAWSLASGLDQCPCGQDGLHQAIDALLASTAPFVQQAH